MIDEYQKTWFFGLLWGIGLTVFAWLVFAEVIEALKIENGYLTYRRATYKVELYDTLEKPKMPVKEK